MLTAAILLPLLLVFLAKILFAIDSIICKFIDILYECFEVFAGVKTITYKGETNFLLDVFFENKVISTVYWGMACISFALMFGFAVVAVVRKMFDSTGEKVKATYEHILTNCFKSILLMLLMTAIVSATISASGTLMRAIADLFDSAEILASPPVIYFDDEDYATMYRIYNTIGNYSINTSYDSRYNLNACFNDIRNDMQELEQKRVFEYSYLLDREAVTEGPFDFTKEKDKTLYDNHSWQYELLQIYQAADIYQDMDIDAVDDVLHECILRCMDKLKTDPDFKPLKSYSDVKEGGGTNLGVTIGRTIMLTASFGNAKQSKYDNDPGVSDPLRYPYYVGQKNVYSYDTVDDDFEIGIFGWNHLMVIVVGFFITKELLIILINATARIFNIILLYITAPPFLAVMPLDDGGKFKQWTTAFVIQSLSLFGSFIAIRLLVIFIPIVMGSQLRFFSGAVANYMAKLVFLIGICVTSEKASGMISGILADNAGYQSIMAGDVGGGVANSVKAIAGKALSMAVSAGAAVGKGFAGAVDDFTGVSTAKKAVGDKVKNFGQSLRDHGGFRGAKKKGFQSQEQLDKASSKAEKEAERKDTQDWRSQMLDAVRGNPTNQGNTGGGGSESEGGSKDAPPSEGQ